MRSGSAAADAGATGAAAAAAEDPGSGSVSAPTATSTRRARARTVACADAAAACSALGSDYITQSNVVSGLPHAQGTTPERLQRCRRGVQRARVRLCARVVSSRSLVLSGATCARSTWERNLAAASALDMDNSIRLQADGRRHTKAPTQAQQHGSGRRCSNRSSYAHLEVDCGLAACGGGALLHDSLQRAQRAQRRLPRRALLRAHQDTTRHSEKLWLR